MNIVYLDLFLNLYQENARVDDGHERAFLKSYQDHYDIMIKYLRTKIPNLRYCQNRPYGAHVTFRA